MARHQPIEHKDPANGSSQAPGQTDQRDQLTYPRLPDVDIKAKDGTPTVNERGALVRAIDRYGAACFRFSDRISNPRDAVLRLSRAMGLLHPDQLVRHGASGISELRDESRLHRDTSRESSAKPSSSIHVASGASTSPNRIDGLCWHTDGCHNAEDRPVRSFLMLCVTPAAEGGGSYFMDSELSLRLLGDADQAAVQLLSHSKAMTIPAYRLDDVTIRPERTLPVFNYERVADFRPGLVMRFTLDHRFLNWRNDDTEKAAKLLADVIESATSHHYYQPLESNTGVISRNILHRRQAFVDSETQSRHLLRACYYDRIESPAVDFSAPRFGV